MHHLGLYALAHVGDGALGRDAENLGVGKGGHCLNQCGHTCRQGNGQQEVGALLADDFVNQVLRGSWQHQPCQTAHQHQPEAKRQAAAVRPDELARLTPGRLRRYLLLFCRLHAGFP
jgi:hypothetical protein